MSDDFFSGFEAGFHDVPGARLFARIGGRADGTPVLLLHGYPETHAMWRRVAVQLADRHRLVIPDLRGYGDSSKPPGDKDHGNYSKRTMAADMHALMASLGHGRYAVVGHDRGARVSHRLALDRPDAVMQLCVIDIAPTLDMYESTDMRFASAYYHWFHLIQPAPLPEKMIGGDPMFYLRWKMGAWGGKGSFVEPEAMAGYERCFVPETIHAICEDYRASAGIDLQHDRESRAAGQKVACDLLVLWGERGVVQKLFDPMALWRAQSSGAVSGHALPTGHFIPEEDPDGVAAALMSFLH